MTTLSTDIGVFSPTFNVGAAFTASILTAADAASPSARTSFAAVLVAFALTFVGFAAP
jgi:hypothetical protein